MLKKNNISENDGKVVDLDITRLEREVDEALQKAMEATGLPKVNVRKANSFSSEFLLEIDIVDVVIVCQKVRIEGTEDELKESMSKKEEKGLRKELDGYINLLSYIEKQVKQAITNKTEHVLIALRFWEMDSLFSAVEIVMDLIMSGDSVFSGFKNLSDEADAIETVFNVLLDIYTAWRLAVAE
jgi:hypothetical protein